ncbi:hypothetical protein [Pelosinus sp. sgz500959]|uniref:hypothetical protein n=1 Tax=Pelosinus sp. sgz500959 TaxID=3242472 RepID=UPI003672608C
MGMFGMLIGLLVAFCIYNHAKNRGHSTVIAFLWAIGSAAMPIVLVPLYLILGKTNEKQPKAAGYHDVIDVEATVVEEISQTCFKCGSPVKEDFVVCPYCQAPLNHK